MNVVSINNSLTNELTANNAEVNELRDQAKNRIGSREIAREFINENLTDLPVLVKGLHTVAYNDDRGNLMHKVQEKNHSLWVVALQTTIETGHTSYDLLASIFTSWAQDTLGVVWKKENAKNAAKRFVNQMQAMCVLNMKLDKIEFIDSATGEARNGVVVKLSESFQATMAEIAEKLRDRSSMVCRPLVNQPMDWSDAVTGIGDNANIPLVRNSLVSHAGMSQHVLNAVNKLQAVKFTVHPAMIDAAYDILDNQHEFSCTDEEIMMYREMTTLEHGEFYFPVTMDQRGRMYYRGGLLTPQGTDFCKAAFQFAEAKPLGKDGLDAVIIHTANCLGHDKDSMEDRLSVVRSYLDSGTFDAVIDHVTMKEVFPNADVFQGLVAVLELKRIVSEIEDDCLKPEEIKSSLVCHQDGTCNGLQHMAAITHNRATAATVNCTKSSWSDVPADIYGIIADAAVNKLTGEAKALASKYGRSMAKNPVMITGYGAGEETIIGNTAKYLEDKGHDAKYANEIGAAYIDAINDNAGAVRALTEALKARVKAAIERGHTAVQWTTYDGFEAMTHYQDVEHCRIRAGVFNALIHKDHDHPLDTVKTVGAMAPNFIHSIDACHLRLVVNQCNHELVTVHDSIGSRPCDFFKTAQVIRETFVEVHKYDALESLCSDLKVRKPNFRGDYLALEALESSYIFS